MISNTAFDTQFDQINGLLHYPWIGKDYFNQSYKLLILGDSHYTVAEDEYKKKTFCQEEYVECLTNKKYTRKTLNYAVNREDIWSFYNGLYSLFSVSSFNAEELFWEKIAFYNYVQEPMKQINAKPTVKDFKTAWFCLLDVIDIIKPDVCLFIGTRGWVSNGFINKEGKGFCKLDSDSVRISRCVPWIADIKTLSGISTKAIAIHHTSQGFSPDKWRDYLQKRIPEIFQVIR